MQIAIIGLGRMGKNMAERLLKAGHDLVVYDRCATIRKELVQKGAKEAQSLADLKDLLKPPRKAWIMVPHEVVDAVIDELKDTFIEQDIIIDGGNSNFLLSKKRYEELKKLNIHFVDVGVSGGIFGLERGYCLMVGGDKKICEHLYPIFRSLAPGVDAALKTYNRLDDESEAQEGYLYCGQAGAGHYVKMIHNGIEYGMMQSYAEGLDLLKNADSKHLASDERYDFDIKEIVELWRRGSVISSWLLDLMAIALNKDENLDQFSGMVPDSGEGRWALIEAIKQKTPAPNLANALFTRFRSQSSSSFAEKSLSALRKEFGGHEEK